MCAEGSVPIVGEGTGRFSFIHVEDAAAATVAAIEARATGVFNIVDDEPVEQRDLGPGLRGGGRGEDRRATSRSGSPS